MTVLEGAIRKWLIGTEGSKLSYLVYFSKDLIFASLPWLPSLQSSSPALDLFRRWLFIGCGLLIGGFTLSLVSGFNAIGAALTLRAVVFLPVIAWLAVTRLRPLPVRRVLWAIAVLTLINCVLAIVQNRLPAEHPINRYVATTENVVTVESGVRATGTFSFITGLAIISTVGIWAGMVLLSLARTTGDRIAGFIAIVSGFGCGLASVSRGPVVMGVAMLGLWMLFPNAGFAVLSRNWAIGVLIITIGFGAGVSSTFSQLWSGVEARHQSGEDSLEGRTFGQLGQALHAIEFAPLGRGPGSEQVGGNYASSGTMTFTSFEAQLPRLIMETGVLGLAGFVTVCAGAIVALQRARREARTISMNAALLATQIFLVPMFYANVVFNHIASAFVWMIFAAMMAVALQVRKKATESN